MASMQPFPLQPSAAVGPARNRLGSALGRWLRENLFSTWYNTLLTIGCLGILYAGVVTSARWIFWEARWEVIPANITPLLIGTYPRCQSWRLWGALLTLALLTGLTAGVAGGKSLRVAIAASVAGLLCALLPLASQTRA